MPGSVGLLGGGHCPPGGAVSPAEAHGLDLLVNSVRADLSVRPLDELLGLRQELVDQFGPGHRLGRVDPVSAELDIPAHRVMVAAGQLGGLAVTPREVIRLEYFHDLLIALHQTHSA